MFWLLSRVLAFAWFPAQALHVGVVPPHPPPLDLCLEFYRGTPSCVALPLKALLPCHFLCQAVTVSSPTYAVTSWRIFSAWD